MGNWRQLADFVSGLVVMFIGVAGLIYSVRIPMPSIGAWFSHPGLMPGLISTSLIPMGMYLSFSASKDAKPYVSRIRRRLFGKQSFSDCVRNFMRKAYSSPEDSVPFAFMLILIAYVLGLTRGIAFPLATMMFLVASMSILRAGRFITIVLIAGVCSVGISLIFSYVFKIPLP